ncbi:2-polyprenyl-3-methyl-5-hydroxy-6-metoxy-1,4-benzoquinol methylase [Salirhabdus euzebyi]|uniref:2-polyprenyl-3-methyl-5-hydroxy-6-metoxy-1, 4-benzoquinol methylase n=1 Tax=Salirhabdus euzebyi TaxID=394506 RepID=A0A841Q139_9BACI|nr:methyltransferase domain-containing protein [Salirhabdus euzebyi]MBB6451723.1 2-polyprenyl-3-methyl-5-hydroxy-6-metoxy-1,4-benzoquinol methylase [Salirhabdus euzebyi]
MNSFEKQLKSSWEENSKAWTQSIREEKIESRNIVTNPAIKQAILSHKPTRVLDVGCGEGWLARELAKENIDVVGIDGSESLIEEAKKLGNCEYHWLNYDQFSKNPASVGTDFDVVVFNFALLSENIQSVIRASAKVLSKTGVIIIQTLHPVAIIQNERYENGWKIESFDGMGEGYSASMPWYYRTLASWVQELRNSELQLVDLQEPIHPEKGNPLSLILIAKP